MKAHTEFDEITLAFADETASYPEPVKPHLTDACGQMPHD